MNPGLAGNEGSSEREPSSGAAAHYARHLAPVYAWMAGGAQAALRTGAAEIQALGLPASPVDLVVDLGAGFGTHAIPLARAGARVLALDSSPLLLQQLTELAGDMRVQCVQDDLRAFRKHLQEAPTAILCMGDTLTHLDAQGDVEALAVDAAASLAPGGRLVLAFRDYTVARQGDDRFIPVRADQQRILTCLLEFEEAHVVVHDLLHERTVAGWRTAVSHYRKLRLAPAWVLRTLGAAGFEVRSEIAGNGMVRVVATQPARKQP